VASSITHTAAKALHKMLNFLDFMVVSGGTVWHRFTTLAISAFPAPNVSETLVPAAELVAITLDQMHLRGPSRRRYSSQVAMPGLSIIGNCGGEL
jgi:cytochrome b561